MLFLLLPLETSLIQFLFVLKWLINISQMVDMDRIDMKMLGLQITPKLVA